MPCALARLSAAMDPNAVGVWIAPDFKGVFPGEERDDLISKIPGKQVREPCRV
jgi:hypothetical protein